MKEVTREVIEHMTNVKKKAKAIKKKKRNFTLDR